MNIELTYDQVDNIVVESLKKQYIDLLVDLPGCQEDQEDQKEFMRAIETLLQYYMMEADALRFILKSRYGSIVG